MTTNFGSVQDFLFWPVKDQDIEILTSNIAHPGGYHLYCCFDLKGEDSTFLDMSISLSPTQANKLIESLQRALEERINSKGEE